MFELEELSPAWNVIVVGAGPAGSAAAISWSGPRAGLRTLLVDAKRFPRRKVCGGCLNQVSVALLRDLVDAAHPIWQSGLRLDAFQLMHRQRSFRFVMPEGLAVDRASLDQALVDSAVAAGVTFMAPATAKLLAVGSTSRIVELSQGNRKTSITAQAVVLATGLGSRGAVDESVANSGELRQLSSPRSRVGIEAIFRRFPEHYCSAAIHMVVAGDGYVGLTQIAEQRLHVAASVDRMALQKLGPQRVADAILQEAGAPALMEDESATWRGTPALTARASRLAAERVFLVGDAAGYIEPFTGEGIRWALESGVGVTPFAIRSQGKWQKTWVKQWESWYRDKIGGQQRLCLRLSQGLKFSSMRTIAHHVLCFQPRVAQWVIRRLNSD